MDTFKFLDTKKGILFNNKDNCNSNTIILEDTNGEYFTWW